MATRAASLPEGSDWSYEVKWDGYRAQAAKSGELVALASRNLKDITRQFPALPPRRAACRPRARSSTVRSSRSMPKAGRRSRRCITGASKVCRSSTTPSTCCTSTAAISPGGRSTNGARRCASCFDGSPPLLVSEPLPGTPEEIAAAVRAARPRGRGRKEAPLHLHARTPQRRVDQSAFCAAPGTRRRRLQADGDRRSIRCSSATTKDAS